MFHRIALTVALVAAPMSVFAAADSYNIDPEHTFPNFTISHLGFSTMHGRFGATQGKLSWDKAAKTATVDIKIDAASVDTGFKKRDDHLRSPDFLSVAEFPDITYKSSKVTFNGDTLATVEGNLTIKGVTKPVTLTIKRMTCAVHPMKKIDVCGFDATAKIKRSDFGVNFALPAVGDEMDLALEVEAFKGK